MTKEVLGIPYSQFAFAIIKNLLFDVGGDDGGALERRRHQGRDGGRRTEITCGPAHTHTHTHTHARR
jgi:hypothetical protein